MVRLGGGWEKSVVEQAATQEISYDLSMQYGNREETVCGVWDSR